MAFLQVIKGSCPGQIIELTGDKLRIGRHPSSEIVLDNAAVSRFHAQILQSHGIFYVEDLRSRNRTYLNDEIFEGRCELHDGDSLQVCDFAFRFHYKMPSADQVSSESPNDSSSIRTNTDESTRSSRLGVELRGLKVESETEESPDASSIITTLNASSSEGLKLSVKPEAKLRAVLDISNAVAHTLLLEDVLQKTLDGLFKIFPQADEGFVLLKDPVKDKLLVQATKSRITVEDESVRISMTIVRQAMDEHKAILSADAVKDSRFNMSDSLSELQIRSMMCAPLVGQSGDVLGVLQIDTKDLQQQFTQDDLDMLVSVVSQVGLAVENAYLHEELVSQREVERDLEVATQIQLSFLPSQTPKIPCYEFSDHYESAHHVGGDYFDYIILPDGRVAIALGDVAGKGIPAALLMARISSLARFHLLTKPTAAEAVTGLNSEIASSGLGHRFITFLVAMIDPKLNEITITNAGHLPPLLTNSKGEIRELAKDVAGMPLGIVRDQEFQQAKIPFLHGDILTLFTDGVTEAMNSQNEIYGKTRLSQFLSKGSHSADEVIEGIVADVDKFCEGRAQRDDMCLVCVKRCE
ncbi:MAG: SpoIIE family protein phosphatase [Planctomycetes bacterium]|nr:SpoIIE family protein phosphatase [Planctomycetota bacterium]